MVRRKSKGVSDKEPAFARTVSQAALLLDVGERVIYRWLAAGAPPKTEKGYDIEALRRWRGQNREPPRSTGPKEPLTGDSARLLRARADEKSATARLRELELEIESGKWTLAEKVMEHDLFLLSLVTHAIDGFARTLPVHLVGLDHRGMYSVIVKEGRALRSRMARVCGMCPDVATPAADRWIIEAETSLDFAMRLYQEVFGEPVPPSCRGEKFGRGSEIVSAVLAKIRSLKGGHDGQVETESALPVRP